MKKFLVAFLLLSMFFPSVLAAEKVLYDDWHYYDDEFIFQDSVYKIKSRYLDVDERIRLSIDGETILVNYDPDAKDCPVKGNLKFCYYSQYYPQDNGGVIKNKATFDDYENLMPGIKFKILELYSKEDMKVTKTISPSGLHIDEIGVITVTIENAGELDAYELQVFETIPNGVDFKGSFGGLTKIGNKLWIANNLPSGKSISYSYEIIMRSFDDITIPTDYSYYYEIEKENLLEGNKELKVSKKGFSANYAFSKSKIDVEDIVSYKVTLKNEDEASQDLEVDLLIEFPTLLEVIPVSTQIEDLGNNKFKVLDTVLKERTNEYLFNVKSYYSGIFDTFSELTVSYEDIAIYANDTKTLTVGNDLLIPTITVSPNTIRGGNEVILTAFLTNNADSTLYNIKGLIENSLFSEEIDLESIKPQEKYTIYSQKYVRMPVNDEEQEIFFVLNGSFESEAGELNLFDARQKVVVKPTSDSFSVNVNSKSNKLYLNQENTITVDVTNLLGDSVNDFVIEDTFSRPVNLVEGKTKETLSFLGGDSSQAYIYKFKIPENFPDDQLVITTLAKSESKDYKEIFLTTIEINRTKTLDIEEITEENNTFEENPENGSEEIIDSEIVVKEKSFWQKFGDFFKNMFKRRE